MDAVLNWIWQGSVVALVTTLVLAAIERSRARDRYLTVWTALLSVLALPIVPYLWDAAADAGTSGAAAEASDPLFSMPMTWWTSNTAVLVLWTVWSAVCVSRLTVAALSLQRVKGRARPVTNARQARLAHWASVMTRGRRAHLVVSSGVRSAAVLGCGAPMIAIAPALLEQLTDEELDGIVIHEWSHVQRRDDVAQLLQSCIRIVAGWHPAVWWLDRQLHLEREIACDEQAVAITGSAKGYAASLVKLAELPVLRIDPAAALAAVGPAGLQRRIVRILSSDRHASARTWRLAAAGASASLCLLAATLGGVRVVEAASAITDASSAVLTAPASSVDLQAASRPSSEPSIAVARSASSSTASDRQTQRPRSQSSQAPADVDAPPAAPQVPEATTTSSVEELAVSRVSGAFGARAPSALTPNGAAAPGPAIVPWRAAADGGVALARESRDAAVTTAGYFTQLGRRIANSF